jgi:hypothetical protein
MSEDFSHWAGRRETLPKVRHSRCCITGCISGM